MQTEIYEDIEQVSVEEETNELVGFTKKFSKKEVMEIIVFLDYFNCNYLVKSNSLSFQEKLAKSLGYVVAPLSVALAIPYGYEFGSKHLAITSPLWQEIAGGYFATVGTLALGALTLKIVPSSWQAMVTPYDETEEFIRQKRKSCFQYSKDFLYISASIASGFISATPNLILTNRKYEHISMLLALPLDVCAFLALGTIRSWAVYNATKEVYNAFIYAYERQKSKNPAEKLLAKKILLREYLLNSKKILNQCDDNTINIIFNNFFSGNISDLSYLQVLNKFIYLVSPINSKELNNIHINEENLIRKLFRLTGICIAFLYPYPGYALAAQTADSIWSILDVNNPFIIKASEIIFGAVSYGCIAALGAIAANDIFGMLYDLIASLTSYLKEKKEINIDKLKVISLIFSLLSILVALSSTAPRVDIAMEYATHNIYGLIVIICSGITAFSADFWALITYKNELLFGKSEKQQLITMVDRLLKILPALPKSTLEEITQTVELLKHHDSNQYFSVLEKKDFYNHYVANEDDKPYKVSRYTERLKSVGFFAQKEEKKFGEFSRNCSCNIL